jgi:5-methylcytosine-specific restriction endonuclease McrA
MRSRKGGQQLNVVGNSEGLADYLYRLFEAQEHKCYYTGLLLTPGVNATVDHIIPVSSGDNDAYLWTNLVWCDKDVNFMKRSMSIERESRLRSASFSARHY